MILTRESWHKREDNTPLCVEQGYLPIITVITKSLLLQEEKKSLKERLQAIQEVTQTVQNAIGYVATLGESVKK